MSDPHPIQMKIIRKLNFARGLRYSDLKPNPDMENNQLQFHLNQILKLGLVEKTEGGYQLTIKGKAFANKMDSTNAKLAKQAKIFVSICGIKEQAEGKSVLFYTRKKHPFFDYQGFPAGKVKLGETFIEAAQREFYEETGLDCQPELVQINHHLLVSSEGDLIEDKLMIIFKAINPSGTLSSGPEGIYQWIEEGHIPEFLLKPFTDVNSILDLVNQEPGTYSYFNEVIESTEGY